MASTQSFDTDRMLGWQRQVARGVATAHPLIISKGAGARLWDSAGTEYLDFVGGISVLNVGHAHVLRIIRGSGGCAPATAAAPTRR